jgi:hypothetical protein
VFWNLRKETLPSRQKSVRIVLELKLKESSSSYSSPCFQFRKINGGSDSSTRRRTNNNGKVRVERKSGFGEM